MRFDLQVWHYDDGLTTNVGSGHSGSVVAVRISPDRKTIVSVGSEGGIFIWKMPPPSEVATDSPAGGITGGSEVGCRDLTANVDTLADATSRVSMSR